MEQEIIFDPSMDQLMELLNEKYAGCTISWSLESIPPVGCRTINLRDLDGNQLTALTSFKITDTDGKTAALFQNFILLPNQKQEV